MPFTIVNQGTFTSAGKGVSVSLPSSADYVRVLNLTQLATQQTTGVGVEFEWFKGQTPQGGAVEYKKSNSSDALNLTAITSGGFSYYDVQPAPEAPVVGSAITNAAPAVVTMTNTFSEGDRVRLYGATGMLQIAGMDFTISSVSGSGFTLAGLDASGFAAAATAVTARRMPKLAAEEPEALWITKISQASQAVVTLSVAHQYVVGQELHFQVPAAYGMVQINGLTGTIVATSTYTVTVDINTTAFTAFALPASGSAATAGGFAMVAPAGQHAELIAGAQVGYNLQAAFQSGQFVPQMYLAAGAQSPAGQSGDVIVWQAYKMEI